jgi:hypothetical protein
LISQSGGLFFERRTAGFSFTQADCPLTSGTRLPDFGGMQIYLFWSEADTSVFGLTLDPEGENLPAEFAPWSRNGDGQAIYADPGERPTALNAFDPVVQTVRREGFYLASSTNIQ